MIAILIILAVLFVVGVYLASGYEYDGIGLALAGVCGIILFFALSILPLNYYGTKGQIVEYQAIKTSIEDARQGNISEIERAALATKIITTNQWVASSQYWNKTIFDIYIPDEVEQLELLK